jgi:predicted XRE-type DNA-binding protein
MAVSKRARSSKKGMRNVPPAEASRSAPSRRADTKVDVGSGNVLRDLGRPDAEERQLKVQMAMRVNALIADAKMTQAQTASRLGIPQPHVSDLINYKLNRFSVDRLIHFATLLGRDVEIVIRPRAPHRESGTVSVLVAA